MANHTYFPADSPDVSTADVVVKCMASNVRLPAHRRYLAALSPQLEAAVVHVELQSDSNAFKMVENLLGEASEPLKDENRTLPQLCLQVES